MLSLVLTDRAGENEEGPNIIPGHVPRGLSCHYDICELRGRAVFDLVLLLIIGLRAAAIGSLTTLTGAFCVLVSRVC